MTATAEPVASERDPNPGTWEIRVNEPPEIVCPAWCADPRSEHLSELWNQEGFVIHHSADDRHGWGLCLTQTPAGGVCPEEPQTTIWNGDDVMSVDEAEARAHAILELVKAARS